MSFSRQLRLRPAGAADRNLIANLMRFSKRAHSHLDWRPVEDWLALARAGPGRAAGLGAQPFLLAERGRRVVGALACPPDPPDTAWLRLFTVADDEAAEAVWRPLWESARATLAEARVTRVAGLSLAPWTQPVYRAAGFQHTDDVVVLARPLEPLTTDARDAATRDGVIRPAQPDDAEAIATADIEAFEPPWQISPALTRLAIAQADCLTVVEVQGQIAGYQLTTASQDGAHLARLAVRPTWRGRGLGRALVADLVRRYAERGARRLTVNTQASNQASLAVYRRLGFQFDGTRYPVFQLAWG
jgi:ribosomal-protein-alanine N-acetyltransferase